MRIWLLCSELHLRSGDLAEAEQCLAEARALSPFNYLVMHARGMALERRGELEAASVFFESALGVNPSHVPSLKYLGKVNYALGHQRTAEQALKVQPTLYIL
jgi:Flp pilus assembly protein TadD